MKDISESADQNKTVADNIIGRYEEVIRGINGYINWVRKKKGAKK